MNVDSLIKESVKINKILREKYTDKFCKDVTLPCKPFGGSPRESIGPWPEIIYKGYRCPRSEQGLCTPCGYSNIERVPDNRNIVNKLLLFQTKYILTFFDEIILKNQRRKHPYPAFRREFPDGRDVMMALSTTGSFFSDYELEQRVRVKILEMILSYVRKRKINIQIFFESHPLDVITCYEKNEFDHILPILRELNAVIIMGLESINDFHRNVLYCKNLQINDFEKAVEIAKNKLKLSTGAFVFVGFHSLNEYETLIDVKRTLSYLKEKEVMPVIMVSNLKPYTMTDLLYQQGHYNLPDPRTILSVVELLKEFAPNMIFTEDWLFADPVGGPPEPRLHPFNNPRKITCDRCSKIIEKAICGNYEIRKPNGLRETYDWVNFEEKIEPIHKCDCETKYKAYIDELKNDKTSLITRVLNNITIAKKAINSYVVM